MYKRPKDLKNDLEFVLSAKNVQCAIRKDEKRCAWAEAVVSTIPGVDWVRVKNSVVHVAFADKSVYRGLLTKQMRNAVRAFDGEIPGKDFSDFCGPGKYKITAPPKSRTLKAKRAMNRKLRDQGVASLSKKYKPTGSRSGGYKVSARNQFARSSAEKFREAQLARLG